MMRDDVLSICEKNFLLKIVSEGHRLDGRSYNESRKYEVSFGSDYGSCVVSLGETKVLAQVSCEIVQPKQIRPNEGILYINVEISSMASPQFEANRQTELSVYLNRLLEKCYKDSKCVDLESLCIVVEEKVWSLRIDVKVLNHAGNLIECASIATVTALAHFRRPDVTRSGDSVTVHSLVERDPIPTVLYHYPICVTFAVFGEDILISDPNLMEEIVCTTNTDENVTAARGILVIGMNQYREICLLNLSGAAVNNSNIVHKAIASAATRCKDVVDFIKKAINHDDNLRQKRTKVNFADIISNDHILSLSRRDLSIKLKSYNVDDQTETKEMEYEDDLELSKYDVKPTLPLTAEVASKGASKWVEISSDSEEE